MATCSLQIFQYQTGLLKKWLCLYNVVKFNITFLMFIKISFIYFSNAIEFIMIIKVFHCLCLKLKVVGIEILLFIAITIFLNTNLCKRV